VVEQDSFSLLTYVQCVAVYGSIFVSTAEGGTHEISGDKRYLKILLGQRDAKMLV
jgi:hypothetical protein